MNKKESPIELNLEGEIPIRNGRKKVPSDNSIIKALQNEWLKNRDNKELQTELWNAITNCAKRMIQSERNKYGFYLSADEMQYKSVEVATYIFTQYNTRPDFILKTPSGYIFLRVKAALFRHKKIEEYLIYTGEEL